MLSQQSKASTRDRGTEPRPASTEPFLPHAILLTEKPATSLVVSMMRPRLKTIRLDPGSDPASFIDQVLVSLPDEVEFFGRVTGFAINYSPSYAACFDRESKLVSEHERAVLA